MATATQTTPGMPDMKLSRDFTLTAPVKSVDDVVSVCAYVANDAKKIGAGQGFEGGGVLDKDAGAGAAPGTASSAGAAGIAGAAGAPGLGGSFHGAGASFNVPRSTTRCWSMTWPTAVDWVSSMAALAMTSTVSETEPTFMVTLIWGLVLTWMTMPFWVKVVKPSLVTCCHGVRCPIGELK